MTSADRVGAPVHSGSTTSSDGATRSPTRKIRAGSGPSCDRFGPGGWWRARPPGCRSVKRAERLLGEGAPWFESWLEHPEHDDPFWAPTQLHAALDRTEIPVLLLTGWQDLFIEQTLEQYAPAAQARRARGGDHRVVEPRPHADQGCADRPARIAGLARHAPGGQPRRAAQPRAHPRQPRRLDRSRGLAARDARAGAVSPAGRPPRRRGATRHGARRRRSPTTPQIRRPPSAVACCLPRAATATTPSWPSAPTC